MNNEITNELNEYRYQRLSKFTNDQITTAVLAAFGHGASGYAGIDAAEDGITRYLWDYALTSAANSGDLITMGLDEIHPTWEPPPFNETVKYVATRVMNAIFALDTP